VNNQERAKQFMPFDALKGLKEALKDREERRTRVPKIELSDDMADELSRVMARVELCSVIRIKFYCKGHYIDLQGTVLEKNIVYRFLKIGNERIYFDDILKIRIIEA
jgi:hypothetical protein